MTKFFTKLSLFGLLAVICGMLTGCDLEKKATFSLAIQEAGPEYVHVQVTSPNAVEIAFFVDTKEKLVQNPVMIFAEGESMTVKPDDVIRITRGYDKDGNYYYFTENTQYYLYMVAKLDESNYSEIFTLPFKTTTYDLNELITIVDRNYDGFRMRLTVPESTKQNDNAIRYSQCCIMTYNYMGSNDYTNLLYNGGAYDMLVKDDKTITYSEDTNWYQTGQDSDGDGEIDWDTHYNPISPGEPVVAIAGEFEWMDGEEDETDYYMFPAGWDPGYYKPLIDESYFSSKNQQSSLGIVTDYEITRDMDSYWTGAFQRKHFRVQEPSLLDGGVRVELVESSPIDLTFEFYPDDNVVQYAIGVFDDSMYDQILELCGGREEYLQWAITSYFAAYTFGTRVAQGPVSMKLTSFYYQDAIAEDTDYHVLVTAMGDTGGTIQSYEKHTFHTTKRTKDAPVIEVRNVPSKTTPYEACFNIKCTSATDNPVTQCYYAANYLRDWLLAVNGGSTYFSLVAGNKDYSYFSAEELEAINSSKGLDISIPSIDGETTRLVVLGYNDEYTPNDLTSFQYIEDCPAVADCTTPYVEAKPYVSTSEYIGLVGTWTASATLKPADGSKSFIHKSKVTIAADLYDYPNTLSSDVYKLYEGVGKDGMTRDEVDALWYEFKQLAKEITEERLENQNRLLAKGWFDKDSYKRLDYRSPYDLFVAKDYSSVDVSSIFNDYGPKWYLEAVKDKNGNVSIIAPFDSNFLPPAANYTIPFYFAGYDPVGNYAVTYGTDGMPSFPVEVSADGNTIKIKPYVYVDKEGKQTKFYPNMIGVDNSMQQTFLENSVVSEVTLTRGWTEPSTGKSSAVAASAASFDVNGALPAKVYKQRTQIEAASELPVIEYKLTSPEQFKKKADKFVEMKFKQNN